MQKAISPNTKEKKSESRSTPMSGGGILLIMGVVASYLSDHVTA